MDAIQIGELLRMSGKNFRKKVGVIGTMKARFAMLLVFSLLFRTANAQEDSVWVCDVKFNDSQFNNTHAGSGFLLKYGKEVYGITAKHVLFFAKTESMKTISFGDELKSWTLRSVNSSSNNIELGKLINEDKEEAIAMPPKGDWLVFEIKEALPKTAKVHLMRETPLQVGEEVFFMGFPYNEEKPVKVKGRFTGLTADGNLSLDIPQGKYGGCSGGPVVDKKGELVGIVSMGYFNKELNKQIFEPASLEYFKEVIEAE